VRRFTLLPAFALAPRVRTGSVAHETMRFDFCAGLRTSPAKPHVITIESGFQIVNLLRQKPPNNCRRNWLFQPGTLPQRLASNAVRFVAASSRVRQINGFCLQYITYLEFSLATHVSHSIYCWLPTMPSKENRHPIPNFFHSWIYKSFLSLGMTS